MPETEGKENRDLVLAPGSYAYVQAENTGAIKTEVGPVVVTLAGQERPVKYDAKSRKWLKAINREDAVCAFVWAEEGDYVILENPTANGNHPDVGGARHMPDGGLLYGHRVVIRGPCTFALWPGQSAKTVLGHHLLSNQYLLVRVYNPVAAKQEWGQTIQTVVKKKEEDKDEDQKQELVTVAKQEDLKLGQLMIVRGDQVSFYIPPTGIEVIPEGQTHVREAVTLERLEYCILVDENGNKRYERGPSVVFPKPTEKFVPDTEGGRKFRAIELTKMAGLHIKVVADYEEEGKKYKAGDEMFITGEKQPIYYPRIEHTIITYGDRQRHFATAIPTGEGRYVMNRNTGHIKMVKGPAMLLPNPCDEVIVRRVLSEKQCALWYPGNPQALSHNIQLAAASAESKGVTRKGLVTEADYAMFSNRGMDAISASQLSAADTIKRGTSYTQPRSITLDTKYDGVPTINVWTGYAVMVVDKKGGRRVEQGPTTILLDYDESLEVLELSTGKPKNTDKLERTVYLRTRNNKVSDIIDVETSDHVSVSVKISLLVNFDGEPDKWFEVENYVKLLCDHVRSVLKGVVKTHTIEEFYANHVPIIRDAILGHSVEGVRKGMPFKENGMIVQDVEVLGFTIADQNVANLLMSAQFAAVKANIDLQNARRNVSGKLEQEKLNQQVNVATADTRKQQLSTEQEILRKEMEVEAQNLEAIMKKVEGQQKQAQANEVVEDIRHNANMKRVVEKDGHDHDVEQKRLELTLRQLVAESESTISRFKAADGKMAEALLALNRDDVLTKAAKAISIQSLIGGESVVEVLTKVFNGTPLANIVNRLGAGIQSTESDTD